MSGTEMLAIVIQKKGDKDRTSTGKLVGTSEQPASSCYASSELPSFTLRHLPAKQGPFCSLRRHSLNLSELLFLNWKMKDLNLIILKVPSSSFFLLRMQILSLYTMSKVRQGAWAMLRYITMLTLATPTEEDEDI